MSVDTATVIVENAINYTNRGWNVIALHAPTDKGCTCRRGKECTSIGKHPRHNEWQLKATTDEDQVQKWFDVWPNSNVGVKLGKQSGIIDIECDTSEAERELLTLLGDDPPVVPTFRAGRGKHRLFAWSDDLPEPDKAVWWHGESRIEFRTGNGDKGAQSVFPPSHHASGKVYEWLVSPDEADPVTLSSDFMDRLWKARGGRENGDVNEEKPLAYYESLQEVNEGNRSNAACSLIGRWLRDLSDVFNETTIGTAWVGISGWNIMNKPPLPETELRSTFDSILRREKARRAGAAYQGVCKKYDKIGEHGPNGDGEWKITIIESEPRKYKLFSPLWATSAPEGCILIESDDILQPQGIRREALEQADEYLEDAFSKFWKGGRSGKKTDDGKDIILPCWAKRLIDNADRESSPPEAKRPAVVAWYLYNSISKARTAGDDQQPDLNGYPVRMSDGSIVFQFERIWERASMSADKVLRQELTGLLKKLECTDARFGVEGCRKKFKRISPRSVVKLEWLVEIVKENEA